MPSDSIHDAQVSQRSEMAVLARMHPDDIRLDDASSAGDEAKDETEDRANLFHAREADDDDGENDDDHDEEDEEEEEDEQHEEEEEQEGDDDDRMHTSGDEEEEEEEEEGSQSPAPPLPTMTRSQPNNEVIDLLDSSEDD